MSANDEITSRVTPALLTAAVAGLLCASAACSSTSPGSSAAADDAGGGSIVTTNGDTPIPDTACDGGVSPDPTVTSSTVGAVTLDQFTSQCNAANGILETQPHCGGSNACRGMSYDSNTQTLTEHTCRATNSCAGYSCVECN